MQKALMSSAVQEWETPRWLFDKLNAAFDFTLDPCSTPENAKAPMAYNKHDNGLSYPWPGRVFMNPPYGREIFAWVVKAWEEAMIIKRPEVVVCLLPARTDTKWFQICFNAARAITFLPGRLKFELGGKVLSSAPFPSVIVVFGEVRDGGHCLESLGPTWWK